MTTTESGSPGISQRTNVYAAKDMLKWAKPTMVLEKFGTPAAFQRLHNPACRGRDADGDRVRL